MKTIRELIEGFIYSFIERLITAVDEGGEDTVIHGVRVLDDPTHFVQGTLVNAAATLYAYYEEKNDERAEDTLRKLHKFIGYATKYECKTWGKIAILRGFSTLYNAGLLNKIDPGVIASIKEKTDYTDFFNKETLTTDIQATNYYHVALACAAYREKFGWDNEKFAYKINNKLINILTENSYDGWLDDQIPNGRFDRYSFVFSAELSDTLHEADIELPQIAKKNLESAASAILFMANDKGDGMTYGRSLSCHGDATVIETLSSAFSRNLVNENQKEEGILYSIKAIDKILTKWYDKERDSFNIWWEGRTTNKYRGVERILEVNLDMANHLFMALKNFERGGVADVSPRCTLKFPNKWTLYDLNFLKTENDLRKTVILRYKDTLAMLPLIGMGRLKTNASYLPYPSICGCIESAPEANHPFLIPEYTDLSGKKYRPCQFFTDCTISEIDNKIEISITGNLMECNDTAIPQRTDLNFGITYTFENEFITAHFISEFDFCEAEMIVGVHGDGTKIEAFGFDGFKEIDTYSDDNFKTPSGYITKAEVYKAANTKTLGYKVTLTIN